MSDFNVPLSQKVLEIGRRVMTRQRELFAFLDPLKDVVDSESTGVHNTPNNVQVTLISRIDGVRLSDTELTNGKRPIELANIFKIGRVATCIKFMEVTLGAPAIVDKGKGWSTIQMPIIGDNADALVEERYSLTRHVDALLQRHGSVWVPEPPSLRVVEFPTEDPRAGNILKFVEYMAPDRTELFDASIRLKHPPVL